jgi:hypothetical protein
MRYEDTNLQVIGQLYSALVSLYTDWHHKALPDGEYPATVAELIAAYPEIPNHYDIEKRASQYTGRESVMVRLKPKN